MNIEQEILDTQEVLLTVTVNDEQWESAQKAAARRISGRANIPGFRKGKAPYNVIKQYFGDATIMEEALEPLSQEMYTEALSEADIDPYAPGLLVDIGYDPLTLTYRVPLAPHVELGDYRDVRIAYEEDKITEEDVEKALENVREQQATLESIEQPVEMGMAASIDIHATIDSDEEGEDPQEWLNRSKARVLIDEDSSYPVVGFPEHIVGMEAGDEKSFDITVPEDDEETDEDYRGKTIHFDVKVNEVFTYDVPDLTDELVQSVSDFDTVDELRDNIRERLAESTKEQARETYLDQMFEKLEDQVTVAFPPVIIEQEIDNMIEKFEAEVKRRAGLTLDDYMKINDLTEDDLREDYHPAATRRIRRGLILGEIVEQEQIKVDEEEVEDEIQTMLLSFGGQAAVARNLFKGEEAKQQIRSQLLTEKAIDRLLLIGTGEAPELEADSAESENE